MCICGGNSCSGSLINIGKNYTEWWHSVDTGRETAVRWWRYNCLNAVILQRHMWPFHHTAPPTEWITHFRCAAVVFTALHRMQTRSGDENSVCPSVHPSVKRVLCDNMAERSVHIFISYERSFSLVFWEEEWLVGGPLLPEILGQRTPVGAWWRYDCLNAVIFQRHMWPVHHTAPPTEWITHFRCAADVFLSNVIVASLIGLLTLSAWSLHSVLVPAHDMWNWKLTV